MNIGKFLLFLCLLIVWFVCPSSEVFSEDTPIKLAIVDVGIQEKVPASFMDLLLVSFNRHPEVTVLERTEMSRILKEQALSLSFSTKVSDELAISAGKLLVADAFLMLEKIESPDKRFALRIRLVETRYGMKIWDSTFISETASEKFQDYINNLTGLVSQKIVQVKGSSDQPIMVGVSDFRSEEISGRWNWLSETFATGIEQNLGLVPGIMLMERTRTRPLSEERELVEGLPESLKSSAVFIDGTYKMVRDKGPDIASTYIRCRRNNKIILETRVEGSINSLGPLYKDAVRVIMKTIKAGIDIEPMNPQVEADMLAAEARAQRRFGDFSSAYLQAEAALAFVPDSVEYNTLLLEILPHIISRAKTPKERAEYILRGMQSTETALNKLLENPGPYIYGSDHINNFLRMVKGESEQGDLKDQYGIFEEYFWRIVNIDKAVINKTYSDNKYANRFHLDGLLDITDGRIRCCTSTEKALELSRNLLSDAAGYTSRTGEVAGNLPVFRVLMDCLNYPQFSNWATEKDSVEKVGEFLEETTHSDELKIRFFAEANCMFFYSKYKSDYNKAQKHFEIFRELLKNEIPRNFPKWNIPEILKQFYPVKLSDDEQENIKLRAEIFPPNNQERRVITPPQTPKGLGISKYKATPILTIQDIEKAGKTMKFYFDKIHLRRLAFDNEDIIVIFSTGDIPEERFGMLKLDKDSLTKHGLQFFLTYFEANRNPNVAYDCHDYYGPSVTTSDGNTYLGFPTNGILVFQKDGMCSLMNEENGLASDKIESLDTLDNKLYAVIGTPYRDEDHGLMEVDLKSGISQILASPRSKEKKSDIDGRAILSIKADKEDGKLWIVAGRISGTGQEGTVFSYQPELEKYTKVDLWQGNNVRELQNFYPPCASFFDTISKDGDFLIVGGFYGFFSVNMKTNAVTRLIKNDSSEYPKWKFKVLPRFVKLREKGFLAADYLRIAYFDLENRTDDFFWEQYPSEPSKNIHDIALTPKGLFVLTDDTLCLIPEIK